MDRMPITQTGFEKLKEELDNLKSHQRPAIIEAIAEARSHGDLKENAEYHAAREQQGFIEGRISDLESKIPLAHVIDLSEVNPGDKIIFGATVTLMNLDTDEEVTYQIVGEYESDIKAHKISLNSPIARALIGKHEGDEVKVQTPGGILDYEIVTVTYQ